MRRRADYVTETKQNSLASTSGLLFVLWFGILIGAAAAQVKKMKVCDSGRMTQCGVCKKMDEYNKH